MTSIIANGGNDTPSYPTVSVGVHKARCVRVIDLGTQQNDYQGQISWKRQVMLIWEVPSETDNKGEPLTISKFYTLSLNEKANLANDLVSWRGRPFTETEKKAFDISKVAGKPCSINVILNQNGKPKVSTVMPIGKNDEIAQQFHPNMVFSITDFQEKKMEVFNQLPEGIRNIILKSKELEGTEKQDLGDENNAQDLGDIPF
ncbi:MAG: hypothetical protein Tp1124SUR1240571_17 [Prokaryotic dsDNA virus sp.]|jgi:hypothetical protein|nr:MAG: hypothetical protein Tp1124SUR1240571_17 [Prokaryotic dsDNA virus sp.]|tara:strand:- start:7076 stop:7681 length:606 start_codon:yes stop_codon:yes gene_type:complete